MHPTDWITKTKMLTALTIGPIVAYGVVGLLARIPGIEFIPLLLAIPIILFFMVILGIDLVAAFTYLLKEKPPLKKRIFPVLVIVFALVCYGYFAWTTYYIFSGKSRQDIIKQQTISKEDALKRIGDCEVDFVVEGDPPFLSPKSEYISKWGGIEKTTYIEPGDYEAAEEALREAEYTCENT